MKLLSLGTGPAQKDLIITAKELGMTVYACSSKKDDIAEKYLDGFSHIDIRDVESIIKFAKSINVDYIYSVGSDFGIYSSLLAAQVLKLPIFNNHLDYNFTNKTNIRSRLANLNENLRYSIISDKKQTYDLHIYPCIIKPCDSQGQRGVFFIENYEDLDKRYFDCLNFSNTKELIIEEYIDGIEYSANLYLINLNIEFIAVTQRISTGKDSNFKPLLHIIKNEKELVSKIKSSLQNICFDLQFKDGPIYAQIKLKDGEIKLIEITPRLDGCHLWRLIDLACGYNLLNSTILHLFFQQRPNFSNNIKIKPHQLKFIYNNSMVSRQSQDKVFFEYYEDKAINIVNTESLQKIGYKIEEL